MEPTPTALIPIYVGGLSEIAFARAARHDGWVGDMYPTEEAIRWATSAGARSAPRLGAESDFSVYVALTDAILPEHFARAEEGGVTDCMTLPWMYYSGRDATVEQKLEGMRRFAEDVTRPLGWTRSPADYVDRPHSGLATTRADPGRCGTEVRGAGPEVLGRPSGGMMDVGPACC